MKFSTSTKDLSAIIKELTYEIHKDFASQLNGLVEAGYLIYEINDSPLIAQSADSAELVISRVVTLKLRDQEIINDLRKMNEALQSELTAFKNSILTMKQLFK